MKASRYYELFSKIDTDSSTDEKIKNRLQDYQNHVESIQRNKHNSKLNKTDYIFDKRRGFLLRNIPKVSILRQVLPSLAFLLLLTISIYGLVTGLYKDRKNIDSELTVSSETASDTGESLPNKTSNIADTNDEANQSETESDVTGLKSNDSEANNSGSPDGSVTGADGLDSKSDDSDLETDGLNSKSDDAISETPDTGATKQTDDIHYVVTANNAETLPICTAYYKNDTYREDLKIYVKFNDASEVKSLFIQSLGTVDATNYSVDDNIITLRKDYLDTIPDGMYTLKVNMDKGNPVIAQFIVHPKEVESEFGFYHFSSYYWDFYLSDPKDFTFLVFNRKDARITELRNGSVAIDPDYYKLDENGYVATLYQSYMADMEEGIRFDLTVEFSDGMEKTIGIKIRYKEVNAPYLNSEYNIFEKSKPEDVKIKIIWNDAKYITKIDPETHFAVGLSSNDYTLENDIFTIKKEFLSSLAVEEYIWYLDFDTETGSDIRVKVKE